jgi:putative nucleotidyltransferase with HDIG domain
VRPITARLDAVVQRAFARRPDRLLRAYVVILAALAVPSLLLRGSWSINEREWVPALIVLVPLAIVLEFASLPLPSGGTFSMATVPHVAMILLVPAPMAAIAAASSVLVEQVVRRAAPTRLTFNVAGTALTASIASHLMGPFGSVWESGSRGDFIAPLPLIVAALTYFVVNAFLLGIVLSIVERRSLRSTLRPDTGTVAAELAAAAIGAQFALIWTIDPLLVVLIAVPGLVIAQSFDHIHRLASETKTAVRSLAEIIDHRDQTTYRHSARVADNAARLARAMGLPEPEVELIEQAAAVHDVGKIGVQDAVLLKAGPLTDDEDTAIRRHAGLGSQILTGFSLFRPGADIVLHHHERWDGLGYPDGLAGEAIPLGARVVAVVDSFDAMTSDRPYRAALQRDDALRRIAAGAGTQWDPEIVRVFLDLEGYAVEGTGAQAVPATRPAGPPSADPARRQQPAPADLEVAQA